MLFLLTIFEGFYRGIKKIFTPNYLTGFITPIFGK